MGSMTPCPGPWLLQPLHGSDRNCPSSPASSARIFFRLFMEVDPICPLRMRIFGKWFFRGFLHKELKGFCYVSQFFGRAKYLNLNKSLRRFDVWWSFWESENKQVNKPLNHLCSVFHTPSIWPATTLCQVYSWDIEKKNVTLNFRKKNPHKIIRINSLFHLDLTLSSQFATASDKKNISTEAGLILPNTCSHLLIRCLSRITGCVLLMCH